MGDNYFKTGDIAKFHNVSPDTVRYYDKEGLVKPSLVRANKYRYYTLKETVNFGQVTMLRELDVPIASIRESLGFAGMEELLAMNERRMEDMRQEMERLRQKLDYLDVFNARLKTFHEKPNEWEMIEEMRFYVCKGMKFHINTDEVEIGPSFADNSVDDLFWSRTSLISRVRKLRSGKEEMYCGNVIGSDCDLAEPLDFGMVLRYNYVGDPFKDADYRSRIDREAGREAKKNKQEIGEECYEFLYACLEREEKSDYYVHLVYPLLPKNDE